jgi:hypothetical protein
MRWRENPAYIPRPSRPLLHGRWRLIWALACVVSLIYLMVSEMYVGAAVFLCLMIVALTLERRRRRGSRSD